MRFLRNGLLATAGVLGILAVGGGVAQASIGLIETFGSSGPGQILEEGGIAVNQATNDVYVADITGQRVLEYTPTGELILMFGRNVNKTKQSEGAPETETNLCTTASKDECGPGEAGSANGQFNAPTGVAVDPITGDVYVADEGNDRVQKFTPEGVYLSQIDSGADGSPVFHLPPYSSGITIDSNGNLLLISLEAAGDVEGPGWVLEFNALGVFTGLQFGPATLGSEKLEGPFSVGVDERGFVYVGRRGGGDVVKFSPGAQAVGELGGTGGGASVGVDPRTGDVFVAEPEGKREVVEFSSAGVRLANFGPIGLALDVAYDTSEGRLYVSDAQFGRVSVFGPFEVPSKAAPLVEGESITGLAQSSVTLSARVTANGEPTSYSFQYAASSGLEGAQSTSATPVGSGFGARSARATVGVQPDTVYYYRLVAQSSFGGGSTVYGPVERFVSPAEPAVVLTGAAVGVTQDSVVLTGVVTPGAMGPAADTRWCFEYGTSAAYEQGAVPLAAVDAGQGSSGVPVSVEVGGLWPGTVYHYRLVAVNSLGLGLGAPVCGTQGGVQSVGSEQTFTTSVPPAPSVSTGAISELGSTSVVLTGVVDPRGVQSTYEFELGRDTAYGTRIFGDAGSGQGPVSFGVGVGGLLPGATYHYRLAASSASGVSYGADDEFTTPVVAGTSIAAPTSEPLLPAPVVLFPGEPTGTGSSSTQAKAKPNAKKKAKARAKPKRRAGVGRRKGALGRNGGRR